MLQRYQPQPCFTTLSQQWKRASNSKRQRFSTHAAKRIWQFKSSNESQQKSNTALQGLFKCALATEPSLLQNWENAWQGIHRKGHKPLQLEMTLFIEVALWIICCVERHLHAKAQPSSLLQQLPLRSVCAGLTAGVFLCTVWKPS